MSECGTCKHHFTGVAAVPNVTEPENIVMAMLRGCGGGYQFRGHGGHPNGRCDAPDSPYFKITTGYYGLCPRYESRT